MKLLTLACAIAMLTHALEAQEANRRVTASNSIFYGPYAVTNIDDTANISLQGSRVSTDSIINGNLFATNALLQGTVVNGDAVLSNSVVNGAFSVFGTIQAANSQVYDAITTYADNVVLDSCKTKSIYIKNNGGEQTVTLYSRTVVDGTIVFEFGKGLVNVFGGSYVSGPITGARRATK